ncbi:MAG: MauE/DoxX family redox-associated membrane protein [Phycisphaerales bacterium JB050]
MAQQSEQTKTIKPAPAGWNIVTLVTALVICAVIGIAAYSKIVDPNKAKFIAIGDSELKYERFVGIFEVLVVLALLAGHRLRLAWLGVVVMFSLFAGYAAYYYTTGNSCGCFGNALEGTPLEWMAAKGVSLIFDALFVITALALLAWRGFGAKGIQGLVGLVLILFASGVGLGALEYANVPDEPTEPDVNPELPLGLQVGHPAAALLRQEHYLGGLIADSAGDPGKMWYIFVYDPDCSECMELFPLVEMDQQQYEDEANPYMAVETVTKQHAEEQYGIDFWSWPSGATIIIVQNGDIHRVYDHELTPQEKPTPAMLMDQFFETGEIESNWPPAPDEEN